MAIDLLREFCLSLPGATEDIKYGSDLCFSVGNKIFCGTRISGQYRTGFKCDENDFAILIERENMVKIPYRGNSLWIRAEDPAALTHKEWEYYLKRSYDLIIAELPAKKRPA